MDAYGNLTQASKSLKCDRRTLYGWIEQECLQDTVQEGRDQLLDEAENQGAKKIKEGDTSFLIFFLKTQGRSRGYVERQDVNHSGNMNISGVDFSFDDDGEEENDDNEN